MTTVLKFLVDLSGQKTGLECRRCREAIPAQDMVGTSEGVCAPCRHDSYTGNH